MMNPFISCIVYGLESLIYYSFFSRVGSQKFPSWICFLIGLSLFEIISAINLIFHNTVWINIIATIPINTFFFSFCFQKGIRSSFCYATILTTLELALEMVVILGTSAIFSMQVTQYNNDISVLMLEFLSCKAPFFLITMILANIGSNSETRKVPVSLFVFPTCAICSLFISWYISCSGRVDNIGQILLSVSNVALFVSTVFLFYSFQNETKKDIEMAKIQRENSNLRIEKDYYGILEQQNQNLLMYAHDVKKHLTAIQELSEDPRVDEYIAGLYGHLKGYSPACHCGNKLLDVMINRYDFDSKRKNINFEYDVMGCSLSGVDDLDLVAIIGNLMDNAFQAAEHSMERRVTLETARKNSYSIISLRNSCDAAPLAEGEKLISTKENPRFHGHGLKSVAKTLKKYQGDFYWKYMEEDKIFAVTVMLKEEKSSK